MAGTFDGEEDIQDAIVQAIQADAVAYAAWGKAKGKGEGTRKGKSNGKGKGSEGQSPSAEERKKMLAELKARTNCQSCGEHGRWAGDAACPKLSRPFGLSTARNGEDDDHEEDSPLCAGLTLQEEAHEQQVAFMNRKGNGKTVRATAAAPPAPQPPASNIDRQWWVGPPKRP